MGEQTRRLLENLMNTGTYTFQSDFAQRYITKGLAQALLGILAARGIDLSEGQRMRVTGCSDVPTLDLWLRRAARANSADDVFAEADER